MFGQRRLAARRLAVDPDQSPLAALGIASGADADRAARSGDSGGDRPNGATLPFLASGDVPIDIAQPGFKKLIRLKIAKPEIIKVGCDAHNWMEGWWYVVGDPYYAVTGTNGHFTIGNVPAGTYTLKVWQEKLGVETQSVTVKPGAAATVDFTFKAK